MKCPTCNGEGSVPTEVGYGRDAQIIMELCPDCNGSGIDWDKEQLGYGG